MTCTGWLKKSKLLSQYNSLLFLSHPVFILHCRHHLYHSRRAVIIVVVIIIIIIIIIIVVIVIFLYINIYHCFYTIYHAFIGLSAYLSVCVCLSLCYLFISFYYGFIPDSNKWIEWIGLDIPGIVVVAEKEISPHCQ